MVAGVSDNIQLDKEKFFEFQTDSGPFQFLGVLWLVNSAQRLVTFHQVKWGCDKIGDGLG